MADKSKMEQVAIPNDYFLNMSKKDYTDYQTALIREFFQNSVDAGAKNFRIFINRKTNQVTFTDDGCGMNEDTLRNKLFVLGESHKERKDSIGAFGHAKLLLYFSWQDWEIRTQNIVVTGSANYFDIKKVDAYVEGTISTITVSDEVLGNIRYYTSNYFKYCDTDCVVKISTDEYPEPVLVEQSLKCTEVLHESDVVKVSVGSMDGWYIIVRQNGVYMFQQYMYNKDGSDPMPIIEVKLPAVEIFMQSRDHFKKPYDAVMEDLKAQLTSDSVESFRLNQEGDKHIDFYDIPENAIPYLSAPKTILTHDVTADSAKKLFGKKRNLRLISICEAYLAQMRSIVSIPDVEFGITESGYRKGLCKRTGEGKYQVFLNLDLHVGDLPNYRKCAVMILNTMKHEVSHVITAHRHGTMAHDEHFVNAFDELHDKFWDIVPFVKTFKETWSDFK